MVYEEAILFKDFGPVIALIIIMVIGGKWILQHSFEQVELARKDFTNYVENTEKEHTTTMNKMSGNISKLSENISVLSTNLNQHTKTKEEFIDTINEQRKTISELFEMLKDQIKTNKFKNI